ncbi:peptidase [Aerococcus urinaehominis]|uniref:Peptidase n=1 Tax=Aerococcus urinaehominis TaxID=128944 RepID=A0A0X8FLI0_9LACT|nr:zinc metallopeptidase [Aerococcus urinaehominis]AMB99527.1 peptidase [Aerococcus urinaehominis]SDM33963.1 hypothetical protein SAMN04487985_1135 [Aerococcus urinaehominis]
MPFLYFGPGMILVVIGSIIAAIASWNMQRTFQKYDQYQNKHGYTGKEIAELILQYAGIHDVRVEHISGQLTDHYDPKNKVLRLSDATYNRTTVTAVGVAAHECGHAVQDDQGYWFMRLRQNIVPIVNIGSNLGLPILLLGTFFGLSQTFVNIGLILFSLTFIFQLITLPVEFDASKRALDIIEEKNLLTAGELPYAKKTLTAAALTYVAAAISSLLVLLRMVLIFGGRRHD